MDKEKCCGACCWMIGEDHSGFGLCAKIFAEQVSCKDDCHEDHFVSREEMEHHLSVLTATNRWRRDQNVPSIYPMPNPKEIGLAIDFAVDFIKTFMEL